MSSLCVVCCASSAVLYCCQDDANLCKACSLVIHNANAVAARHNVIPFCTLCTVARSTVFCKNDDAYLCATCDKEAHQGPLAARHERVPAALGVPAAAAAAAAKRVPDELYGESSGAHSAALDGAVPHGIQDSPEHTCQGSGDFGVVPDLSPPTFSEDVPAASCKGGVAKPWGKDFGDLDIDSAWLDRLDMGFDFSDILDNPEPFFMHDGAVVPSMSGSIVKEEPLWGPNSDSNVNTLANTDSNPRPLWDMPGFLDDSGFMDSEVDEKSYGKHLRLDVVSEAKDGATVAASPSVTREQATVNRADRLTKCREKRKNRTFEKTIRYATRKAYAEIRPRIKGRFVKKEELEAYRAMYGCSMPTDEGDGVVPNMAC